MIDLDAITLSNDARQGEFMLNAVFKFTGRFVSYPSEATHIAHVLWCVHTHLMDCWESTPRLAFLSPEPGSGKTRALEITELLVPNAVQTVNVSPAYLFRRVSNEGGATILYDEIDTIFGQKAKENEDIRGFLNAGHRRGASFGRCVITGKTIEKKVQGGSSGTLAWLIERYRETGAWTNLSLATRRQRENIFRHVLDSAGRQPLAKITTAVIKAGRDRRTATPA